MFNVVHRYLFTKVFCINRERLLPLCCHPLLDCYHTHSVLAVWLVRQFRLQQFIIVYFILSNLYWYLLTVFITSGTYHSLHGKMCSIVTIIHAALYPIFPKDSRPFEGTFRPHSASTMPVSPVRYITSLLLLLIRIGKWIIQSVLLSAK